jgi:hypothetical protein
MFVSKTYLLLLHMDIPQTTNPNQIQRYLGTICGIALYGQKTRKSYILGGGKLDISLMKEVVETKLTFYWRLSAQFL